MHYDGARNAPASGAPIGGYSNDVCVEGLLRT